MMRLVGGVNLGRGAAMMPAGCMGEPVSRGDRVGGTG